MEFYFPDDLRPPTVDERDVFYESEFDIQRLHDLQYMWSRPVLVIDVGTDTTRYKPRFKKYKGKLVYIREYDDIGQLKTKLETYAPEDVYYDTRVYDEDPRQSNAVWKRPDGKQLVFDLDPELVDCKQCARTRQHIDDDTVASYTFCENCFEETARAAAEMRKLLDRHFEKLRVFFSGRGFHVHVRDRDAFYMDDVERQELATKMRKKFPLDEKLTSGDKTMLRLPGSLHGLTGRKVVEVSLQDLDDPLSILYEKSVPESF